MCEDGQPCTEDGEIVVEYTDAQKAVLVNALEDIHGNPHAGSEIVKRTYLVMAFTEYDDGIAASMGAFGSKGLDFSGDKEDVARRFVDTDLATISCSLAAKSISAELSDFTDTAQSLRLGAKGFLQAIDKAVEKRMES